MALPWDVPEVVRQVAEAREAADAWRDGLRRGRTDCQVGSGPSWTPPWGGGRGVRGLFDEGGGVFSPRRAPRSWRPGPRAQAAGGQEATESS